MAKEAAAIPCRMPMAEHVAEFKPSAYGWGLIHAETGETINPLELVSEQKIEMSDWELHDFAIQIVKDQLGKEGKKVFSKQSSLHIDPSIWFEESDVPYWVVVRAVRYPASEAKQPANIQDIKANCAQMGKAGYFASVAVMNTDDPMVGKPLPLYRGNGIIVNYKGLEQV